MINKIHWWLYLKLLEGLRARLELDEMRLIDWVRYWIFMRYPVPKGDWPF